MNEISDKSDYLAFETGLDRLGAELQQSLGWADYQHLRRIEIASAICSIVGYATAWLLINPISIFLIAQGMMGRFFMGHHIGHGGYDQIAGIPERYTRRKFGRGWRRLLDWPDWWNLDDWQFTHNRLHHPHTQSPLDADIMRSVPGTFLHRVGRYAVLIFATLTWKFTYYAPRMHRERAQKLKGVARDTPYEMQVADLVDLTDADVRTLWLRDYLPYIGYRFALPAAVVLPLGAWASVNILLSLVLAELVHNAQTFGCIRPNHCAGDIPLFAARYENKREFYAQSVLGTVNYRCGGDIRDFLHGWTNYQIEHHLWPTATLRQYQLIHPAVVRLCRQCGVPYREGQVFLRYMKMSRLFVGLDRQPMIDTRSIGAGLEAEPVAA